MTSRNLPTISLRSLLMAGKHFDFVSSLNASPEGCLCADAKPDISLALTVAIKGADLGHSLKPWPLHLQVIASDCFGLPLMSSACF